MKVYVLGQEGTGWSIDKDRYYTQEAIKSIDGYEITNNIFNADIIYAIWWNQLFGMKFKVFNFFFKKKLIAAITNDLSHQENLIKSLLNKVDIFVYANSKQKQKLQSLGVDDKRLEFNPFYVDENIFKKLDLSKEALAKQFNIDYKKIENKILIGSFQRDSLGADLSKPKWQKDPSMIVEILKLLPKEKFVLLLAGPRRHYLINECKKHAIDYIFIGDEEYINQNKDDVSVNGLGIEKMPYLYNLIDLYIVSSKSEGGPKAIPESLLCETLVISTDVGFARDLMDNEYIYNTPQEGAKLVENILTSPKELNSKVRDYYSFEKFKNRINNILKKAII